MTLAEATAGFLDSLSKDSSVVNPQIQLDTCRQALHLLTEYFPPAFQLADVTAAGFRDFLARWYLERRCTSVQTNSGQSDSPRETREQPPAPAALLSALDRWLRWAGNITGGTHAAQCSQVLTELTETLPCAIEITVRLSKAVRDRHGAFAFPEFLTSFEEGGRSEYDIDTPGDVGALEGYFQIIRAEGSLIEAEDSISGERVWPVRFPPEVAALLDRPYIINLELVRTKQGWEIADCGFAYPPGTEVG
jgi:hypothetical protein